MAVLGLCARWNRRCSMWRYFLAESKASLNWNVGSWQGRGGGGGRGERKKRLKSQACFKHWRSHLLFSWRSFVSISLIHFFMQVVPPVLHLLLGSLWSWFHSWYLWLLAPSWASCLGSPSSKWSQTHCTWWGRILSWQSHILVDCREEWDVAGLGAGDLGLHCMLALCTTHFNSCSAKTGTFGVKSVKN